MPVTTRIIAFLVGDPELNLHVTLLLGAGQHAIWTNEILAIIHVNSLDLKEQTINKNQI